jgi:nucleotide-binding universal stress UspA family protein
MSSTARSATDPSANSYAGVSKDIDLLIVGTRNSGPLGGLLTGSSSNHLARRAHRPLLVFPQNAGAPG